MEISKLEAAIMSAWCKKTSSDPEKWNFENSALGQCVVTSLVVQDYFGGEIVWAEVPVNEDKISHYFNLVDGKEIDLTRKQFPKGTIVPKGIPKTKNFKTTRDYILSYPETARRYELLKKSVPRYIF